MAERGGFEPPVDFKGLRRFSKPLLSTTQPPLRRAWWVSSGWEHRLLLFLKNRNVLALRHQIMLGNQAVSIRYHFLNQVVLIQPDMLHRPIRIAARHRAWPLEILHNHQLPVRQQAVVNML